MLTFPSLEERSRRVAARLAALPPWVVAGAFFCAGAVFAAYAFVHRTLLANRVIDGVRYFWLDDDMMISMRYARHLANGHGLVWNIGERVEGYTNFLWTVLMAGAHLTGIADTHLALVILGLNYALTLAVMALVLRLMLLFVPEARLALGFALISLVTCTDVMFWAAAGFETTLLTFLQLAFLVRLFSGKDDALAYVPLALIPLARGDALHLFVADAALALWLSQHRARTLVYLTLAALPTAGHFAFRRVYYGEWLPNTYYLKVDGLDDKYTRGYFYARNFLLRYAVVVTLAVATVLALLPRDRRALALFTSLGATLAYAVTVGGDSFSPFRFFAHAAPLVFAFAALGGVLLARGAAGRVAWYGAMFVSTVPLLDPMTHIAPFNTNGDPYDQILVAALLKKNAGKSASIAVIPAGIVPYFTDLPALDMLGKTDRHIAHMKPVPGAVIGHGKVDPEYTLAKRPDYVITCRSLQMARVARATNPKDYVSTILSAKSFRKDYLPNPVVNPFLMTRTAVYTHRGSQELAKRVRWAPIRVSP